MTHPYLNANGPVEHRGVLADGDLLVEYYTRQPHPSRWIAVGVLTMVTERGFEPALPKMIVGVGRSADRAILDLEARALLARSPSRVAA